MAKKIVDEELKFSIVINGDAFKKEYGQLERLNRKLLDSNKDLEAQAHKLKKAGKEQSDEYKKLLVDIESNTKAVNTNKKRMGELTKEIGINNLTMRQLRKEAGKLNAILSNLDPNSDEWKKYNKQLIAVKTRQSELRSEMNATTESMDEQLGVLGKLSEGFLQVFTGLKTGNYKEASAGFRAIAGSIKTATKAGLAFIATPIGTMLAVLAGAAFVAKQWFDYNDAIKESVILTEQITKLTNDEADAVRNRNQALLETFGGEEKENLEVARNLVEQFKISYEEAFDVIEDGLIKGQKNNTEYLDSLREYPAFFAAAGFSAQEFKDIISTGYDLGIYTDKLPDAIKEFDLSIREQTKATREALINAFGQTFTDDLLARVNAGKTTTKEALQEISAESERLGLSIEQNQTLTADVFRGAGEDAGGAVKIMKAVTLAANEANRALTPLEASVRELSKANYELATAQDAALKSDNYVGFSRDLQIFWTKTKTLFFEGVKFITDVWTKNTDFFISSFVSLVTTARQMPSILTKGLKDIANNALNVIKTFGGLGEVFQNLAQFKFKDAAASAKQFKENYTNAFSEVKNSASSTVNQIIATQQAVQKLAQEQILKRRAGNVAAVNTESLDSEKVNPNNGNSLETSNITNEEEAKAVADALRKKQAVQAALDKFDEEQTIRDELKKFEKDQLAEEEEVIRKQLEFEKLEEDADGDKELLGQLETAKLNEIQAIRDSFAEARTAKEQVEKDKLLAQEKKYKQASINAENNFQKAKQKLLNTGLSTISNIFGKETALGKALFLFQKGKAISEIIQSTSLANAKISASLAAANSIAIAASPLTFGQPWVSTNTIAAGKNTAANNINAAAQIAIIGATTLKGFEQGLYPVTRKQDGKRYNAGVNTSQTQIANNPTILVGERPEMIIDPATFNKMDPQIVDYIMRLSGRAVPGFENGLLPSNNNNTPPPEEEAQPANNAEAMFAFSNAINRMIDEGIDARALIGDDNIQEHNDRLNKLNNSRTTAKINN